jgi:hypothetical protein
MGSEAQAGVAGAEGGSGRGTPVPADADASLAALLEASLSFPGAAQIAAPFLPQVTALSDGVSAVLLYGSALWSSVRGSTSHPDFIVVIDSFRGWHRSWIDPLCGAMLPPTVYRLRHGDAYAKLCVATSAQVLRQTSVQAKDLHLAGRLSKRVALVWSRDEGARRQIVTAQAAALKTMARLILHRFPDEIDLDAFVLALLGLSYESEIRIREPGKIQALFAAEPEHYRAVGRALLGSLAAAPVDREATRFRRDGVSAVSAADTRRLLRRSRRRAYLRWPKYLATYDGWLDYLLAKLARSGTPVTLTERQRRHPFIFALPVLYRMYRTRRVG